MFELMPELFWSAVAIVVVNVAVHLSVAKLMCRRVGYKIDENQVGKLLSTETVKLVAGTLRSRCHVNRMRLLSRVPASQRSLPIAGNP